MKITLFVLLLLLLAGCHKPDPNPELLDPIYNDLDLKIKQTDGELASEKKNLKTAEEDLQKAIPQTGQLRFAKKHYFDTRARLEKIKQNARYYKLRKESRLAEVQESYLKAFDKNEPWPDPAEFLNYEVTESARSKERNWSVKKRIQEELSPAPAAAGPKEE